MSEAEKRLEKYFERESRILTVKDKVLHVSEIAYFISIGRKVYAVDQAGKRAEINEIINSLEKRLKKTFVRTHRNYLVAIDSIQSTSRRFRDQTAEASEPVRGVKDEATLYLSGLEDEIPVTETYSKRVQKALGIKNLHYVEPENSEDKRNRELGIIDFGWRELKNLNIKSKKAVEAYKEKWDIMRFSPEKRPEIILAAEKAGFFDCISGWARKVGVTFICLKGEPGNLTIEYFGDETFVKIL